MFRREDRGFFFRLYFRINHQRLFWLSRRFCPFRLQPFSCVEIGYPAFEFILFKQAQQLLYGRLLHFQLFAGQIQFNVGFNGRQLIGEVRDLFVLLKLSGHGFGAAEG